MVMAKDESGAPSNYGAKKSSEYRGSTYGATASKKKTSTRKTVVTPGTKVSQATIDKVKAMGMTKALKGAANASPEMREALKRLYGAKRVAAAGGAASKPASSGGGKYVGSRFVPNTPAPKKPSASGAVYKSADAARAAATKTSGTRMGANTVMAAKPSTTKKTSTTSNPFTALHNKLSPYGNKNQKFSLGSSGGKTVASVKAENAKRMGISVAEYDRRMAAAIAAKKKK
jgi:hypothetical protein